MSGMWSPSDMKPVYTAPEVVYRKATIGDRSGTNCFSKQAINILYINSVHFEGAKTHPCTYCTFLFCFFPPTNFPNIFSQTMEK